MKNISIAVLFVIIILLSQLGCSQNSNASDSQNITKVMQEVNLQIKLYETARQKYEVVLADDSLNFYNAQLTDFLYSNGYDEENAQISKIQLQWKISQWQEYALILQKQNEVLADYSNKKIEYLSKLNTAGLNENSFEIWYQEKLGNETNPMLAINNALKDLRTL